VADSTLATHINAARRVIGDNGEEQRLIRTIARKGFRFVGHVRSRPGDYELTLASGFPVQSFRACLLASDRPAIAVLPFVNMSGDAKQDYFSDGISEDIIMALSKMRWFFVIARNSAFSYKGKSVHAKQIADELGVGYIVEGSVRKDGDRLRITVQLNDVTSGKQLWAERYDRKFSDVFAVQDEITDAIAAAIELRLYTAENVRAQRKPPESLDAWDIVMRALWHFWRVTRADNLLAQMLVEHAIAIDPNYAQALALSAVSHTFAAHMGWEDAATAASIARQAALSAVRADGEDP
jgi:TolB-like protein